MSGGESDAPYVLGHTARELDRLDLQGALYADITRRTLRDAGLRPGMRVLDLGCGSGDVTLLAAGLVGPSGHVTGIDRHGPSVEAARERAARRGLGNVTFEHGEEPAEGPPFDALVARFVLMHQAEPAATLASAARVVRAGGTVAVIESSMASLLDGPGAYPTSERYAEVLRWKCDVVRAAGADLHAGLRLPLVFRDAGLPRPALRMETPLEGGPDSLAYRYMAESVRSMVPMAERAGLPVPSPAEVDALERTLRDETVASGGVLALWPVVSAWCRLPAGWTSKS